MKAVVRLKNLSVEVQGEKQIDLFDELARVSEIFGESKCGLCEGEDLLFVTRVVPHGKSSLSYREIHCQNPKCRARLAFGQNVEGGTLFPKRKLDKDGKPDMERGTYGPHNGWTKYRGEPKGEDK